MARPRKNAPAADIEAKKVETPAEVKAEVVSEVKEDVKAEAPAKKKPGRKPAAEKTAAAKAPAKKPGRKPAAKKTTAAAAEKKPAGRKPALKSDITIQYGSKSFTEDELVKIAKDVWQYDLNQKPADLTSLELYVKPEESMAYYVMNKKFTGSFYL